MPAAEWDQVIHNSGEFREGLANISPCTRKMVDAFKKYVAVMEKAGVPYRYSQAVIADRQNARRSPRTAPIFCTDRVG